MAELRYQLIIDGAQTTGDYTDPDPTTDSGQIVVPNMDSVSKVQIRLPGAPVTLDLSTERGGAETYSFVAFTAGTGFFVGKSTAAGLETWEVAPNGWFMCHCTTLTDDIVLTPVAAGDFFVTAYFAGTDP